MLRVMQVDCAQYNAMQSSPIHYNTGLIKQWSVSVEELTADSCPAEI